MKKEKKAATRSELLCKELVSELSGKKQLEELLKNLTKTIVETALNGELDEHLGYEKHARSSQGNSRNGYYPKTLKTSSGEVEVSIPRDRTGDFEPQFVEKGSSRITHFDEKILGKRSKPGVIALPHKF